ncbi:FAD-binding domain-containing protein [Basidiobolus meristosporus CBS 931.73]|uniref:D-arabinono-1,4-lactone oxidase n=1 Tax=Basidiobolus meristosporus CBS 931.73 TaxID=1314790 RepID=A0A1Y1YD89_9FUNG|nr:FAD-binding domain-containing protein [Basidiobolus meristosporus CBS 931.73]|eukprot:ORX95594.1 FAD-binding domain-containing protein [Basidiobolus meristosporus CBS 931.73]
MLQMTKRTQLLALLGAGSLLCSVAEEAVSPNLPGKYVSWNRYVTCNSQKMAQPSNVFDLQRIVRNAYKNGGHVKGVGHLHSSSDIICTDGIGVNFDKFKKIKIHEDQQSVTVEAGVRVYDLVKYLSENGVGIANFPNIGDISVAGALGTGAHGSSLIQPSTMSDLVLSMRVVTGTGELKTIKGDLLDAFRVHIGVVGLLYDVTLKLIPGYKLHVQNYPVPASKLLDGSIEAMVPNYDLFQVWWFPSTDTAVVSNGTYVSDAEPGNDKWNFITSADPQDVTGMVDTFESVQAARDVGKICKMEAEAEKSFWTKVPGKPAIYSNPQGELRNPAVGFPHDMMSQVCSPCSWDGKVNKIPFDLRHISMGVPLERFKELVQEIQKILDRFPACFPFNGIWFRFSPASDGWMSLSYGRKTVHIEFLTPCRVNKDSDPKLGIEAIQLISQTLVNKFDARPHWGKNGHYYFSHKVRSAVHPKLKEFGQLAKSLDPRGVFSNDFTDRIFHSNPSKLASTVKQCALEDICLCSRDTDCAYGQICVKENEYRYCTYKEEGYRLDDAFTEAF